MSYNDILTAMDKDDILYTLYVPTHSIDYIEIPYIDTIVKLDNNELYSFGGIELTLEDLLMTLNDNIECTFLFDSDKDKLKRKFVIYFEEYIENLKEELSFLIKTVPDLVKTDFISESIQNNPEAWV